MFANETADKRTLETPLHFFAFSFKLLFKIYNLHVFAKHSLEYSTSQSIIISCFPLEVCG